MGDGEQITISNASANRMALFAATGVVDLVVALRHGQSIEDLADKLATLADMLAVYGTEEPDTLFVGMAEKLRLG
jgi:hypothetical protein